jgi:hypothetical protein
MTHVRTLLSHSSKIFTALVAAALVFTWTTNAQAKHEPDHIPANKVAVAASETEVSGPNEKVLLMRTHMRNPNSKALQISVTAECSITTELFTQGDATAEAEGLVDVWIEIVEEDGSRRHVTVSDRDESEGRVTFCNQKNRRTTSFGDDEDHAIETFLRTKSAAGFNWIDLHTGNGIKIIEVYAEMIEDASNPTATSDATALAVVGNRTLVVEPIDTALGETKTEDDVPAEEPEGSALCVGPICSPN